MMKLRKCARMTPALLKQIELIAEMLKISESAAIALLIRQGIGNLAGSSPEVRGRLELLDRQISLDWPMMMANDLAQRHMEGAVIATLPDHVPF